MYFKKYAPLEIEISRMNSYHQTLESRCFNELMSNPKNVCLSDGIAGALVMEVQLYSQFPTEERRTNIGKLVRILISSLESIPLPIGLWVGLVGILYAFEFARSVCTSLLPAEVEDFIVDIDEHLISYLEKTPKDLHFDLISGVVGIGAYALMRTNFVAARRIYCAVEKSLIGKSELGRLGRTWRSRVPASSVDFASGKTRIDLGLAHGLPGVVQLLAGAIQHGLATELTAMILQETVVELIGYRATPVNGAQYPYFDPQDNWNGSRVAWCYGDMGVGFAIASAGRAVGNKVWIDFGTRLVKDRIKQPSSTHCINDNSLCHGHSGAMHIVRKLNDDTPLKKCEIFINEQLSILNDEDKNHRYSTSSGLLEGTAGVLMSLYNGPARGRNHWDICLCLGF